MSEQGQIPAPSTGAGAGTGQGQGGDAIPTNGSGQAANADGGSGHGSNDYLSRITQGGDFAVNEVRSHQSRADKVQAAYDKLVSSIGGEDHALVQAAQNYGADTLYQAVTGYVQMKNHPTGAQLAREFETTGTISAAAASASASTTDPGNDDEWLSEEQKEIRSLREELTEIKSATNGLTLSAGTTALKGHLERLKGELYLTDQEFGQVAEKVESQLRDWSGSDAGRNALRNLQQPGSYTSVKSLVMPLLPEDTLFQLGERKRQHDRNRVSGFETDGPSGAQTTGMEEPPEFKSALEAMKWFREHNG